MKQNHSLIAGLILATAFAGTALAQPPACDYMGTPGKPFDARFDPAQRVERHLGGLKDALKISAAQEPLWQAYVEKMKSEAGRGFNAMRNPAPEAKLSAPERLAQRQTLLEDHLAGMKGVHESFNRLYAALTEEQKRVADEYVAHLGPQKGPRHAPKGPGAPRVPGPAAAPQS